MVDVSLFFVGDRGFAVTFATASNIGSKSVIIAGVGASRDTSPDPPGSGYITEGDDVRIALYRCLGVTPSDREGSHPVAWLKND